MLQEERKKRAMTIERKNFCMVLVLECKYCLVNTLVITPTPAVCRGGCPHPPLEV